MNPEMGGRIQERKKTDWCTGGKKDTWNELDAWKAGWIGGKTERRMDEETNG